MGKIILGQALNGGSIGYVTAGVGGSLPAWAVVIGVTLMVIGAFVVLVGAFFVLAWLYRKLVNWYASQNGFCPA